MYGITETTVHTTYRPLRKSDVRTGGGSLIGIPLPDMSISIVDADLNTVPTGFRGEILVGGSGVSKGYWNRPQLTAERFVPDPHSHGATVYRTGDLGRKLDSGEIEFLGRIDQQVQLRGFRIELGEIEAALTAHRLIREAMVMLHQDDASAPSLVAWMVVAEGQDLQLGDLLSFLRRKLPDYMLPSRFHRVDEMPLTRHGKLDREALLAMGKSETLVDPPYEAPHSQMELLLCRLYAQVLGREQVGLRGNFFELGGDSVRIAKLSSLLEKELNRDVPLVTLFEFPTVESLARHFGNDVPDTSDLALADQRGRRQREKRALRRKQKERSDE